VVNIARTTVVQDAWARGQTLRLHGWVYGLHDGLLRDLGLTLEAPSQVVSQYRNALAQLARGARRATA
jgi:carbonic anhydrase